MLFLTSLFAAAVVTAIPHRGHHDKGKCPPFSGNFTIHQYQLYPENADFDFNSCLLYIGCLWNSSVAIYDPYAAKMIEILEFPNITLNPEYHVGGVDVDQKTGLLSIVVDAGAAFNTGGKDISGTNLIMQWDPKTREILYKLNLTEIAKGAYGGFQDAEQDPDGNVFVVGTFGSSIMKVDSKGKKATPWYVEEPLNHTVAGLSGLAATEWILLGADKGKVVRFDMKAEKGVPFVVPLTPSYKLGGTDAVYLPPRYDGKVLLVAEDQAGISVFRSKDGKWDTAEYRGIVPWVDGLNYATGAIQIGESLYMIVENFGDVAVPGGTGSGNRTDFPWHDITKKVEALLL